MKILCVEIIAAMDDETADLHDGDECCETMAEEFWQHTGADLIAVRSSELLNVQGVEDPPLAEESARTQWILLANKQIEAIRKAMYETAPVMEGEVVLGPSVDRNETRP